MLSRHAISRTAFSNHHEYGLKANPRDLLVKDFDASLYFADWLYYEGWLEIEPRQLGATERFRGSIGDWLAVRDDFRNRLFQVA